MKRKIFFYLAVSLLVMLSCSTEKIGLSPVTDNISNAPIPYNRNFKEQTDDIFYASELTNLISTFPKFSNTALNEEVGILKTSVRSYVYAQQKYNIDAKEKNLYKIEKSYRKIQRLRKFLNKDEDDVLNRYLVRIKSNINKLESLNKNGQKNSDTLK